jgi:hypothetical protein
MSTGSQFPSHEIDVNFISPQKPVVVLAGWLGCQPKSLKRYKSMYSSLGCNVIIRIASPAMVVRAATQPFIKSNHVAPIRLPVAQPETMNELAADTIEEIRKSNSSTFFLHAFSNGGCFLWEAIQDMLTNNERYTDIRSKFAGIVYDSSPCDFSEKVDLMFEALQYCSPSEQFILKLQFLYKKIVLGRKGAVRERQERALEFWNKMKNSSLFKNVPSLYIFSKTDTLTPFHALENLINYRQEKFGKDQVKYLIFEKSRHCRHILTNAQMYEEAIKDLLNCCSRRVRTETLGMGKIRSRL